MCFWFQQLSRPGLWSPLGADFEKSAVMLPENQRWNRVLCGPWTATALSELVHLFSQT